MKIAVTGGAGFIGSNFIQYILRKYPTYQVICIDALTYAGNLESLKSAETEERCRFYKADIRDETAMGGTLFASVDAIVNFAAESHVDRSIMDPKSFTQTNILGTHTLLEVARKTGIRKFVQVSTDEVYGSLGPTGYFTEESSLQPNSPYSASKAGADCLVRAYHETYALPVNITRCSNNYGSYQFPEKLIPLMVINALNERPLPVYGDGQNIRDWLHVEDHCQALDLVLHHGRDGEVYNVGGNNERTNIEIVKSVLSELGKPESLIQFVDDRLGHDRRYAIDATKIRTELGWAPKYTFEEGLRDTIQWYVDNADWWEKVLSGEYLTYYERQYGNRLDSKS